MPREAGLCVGDPLAGNGPHDIARQLVAELASERHRAVKLARAKNESQRISRRRPDDSQNVRHRVLTVCVGRYGSDAFRKIAGEIIETRLQRGALTQVDCVMENVCAWDFADIRE